MRAPLAFAIFTRASPSIHYLMPDIFTFIASLAYDLPRAATCFFGFAALRHMTAEFASITHLSLGTRIATSAARHAF